MAWIWENIIFIVYFEITYGGFIKTSFLLDLQMEVLKLSSYETFNFESSKKFHFTSKLLTHVNLFFKMYLIIQLNVIWSFKFSFQVDWNPFDNLISNVTTLVLGSWPRQEFAKVWVKSEVKNHISCSRKCRRAWGMNPHTTRWIPILGVGLPMDSWIFRRQL